MIGHISCIRKTDGADLRGRRRAVSINETAGEGREGSQPPSAVVAVRMVESWELRVEREGSSEALGVAKCQCIIGPRAVFALQLASGSPGEDCRADLIDHVGNL